MIKKFTLLSGLGLLFFFSSPLMAAPADFNVKNVTFKRSCKNCNCSYSITYPHLEGKVPKVTKPINAVLQKEFSLWRNFKCQDFTDKQDKYVENVNYKVKLKDKGILSIYYYNTGELPGAPYQYVLDAYNFSLGTGKIITLDKIFKKGTDVPGLLKRVIAEDFKKNDSVEPEEYKKIYDFYLTPTHLVLINVIDSIASQALEVKVPYKELALYLDKNGPLKDLLK